MPRTLSSSSLPPGQVRHRDAAGAVPGLGKLLLDKVRGMFAFAIWDKQRGELSCARLLRHQTVYLHCAERREAGPQFIFASEIKCILEHSAYERELNEEALEQYLCFQFSALPETFFKGIYKLEPAHCMTAR